MKLFGHPLHPAIVHFPIACWILAALADAAWLVNADPFFARAALWLQGAGLVAAGAAVIAGMMDLNGLKARPKASGAATMHVALVVSAASAAGASFLGRMKAPLADGAFSWPLGASFAAAALVIAGAYFGAELVYKHGFGRRES